MPLATAMLRRMAPLRAAASLEVSALTAVQFRTGRTCSVSRRDPRQARPHRADRRDEALTSAAATTALAGVEAQVSQALAGRDRRVVLVLLVAPMVSVNGACPVELGCKPGSVGRVDRVVGLGLVQVALANAVRSVALVAPGDPAQCRSASSMRMR